MKKYWSFLLALALVFTLCACKDKTEPEPTVEAEPTESVEQTATPAPANTELGRGTYDSYAAEFVGAEKFTAADGSDALRVYFDFTNRSDETVSAAERLLFSAVQDGKTLNWAESPEPLDAEGNLLLRLQPGHSIRCILQFALLSESTVAVSLTDSSDQSVSALVSLHQLPGAPAEETETACAEPDSTELTTDLPSECSLFSLYSVSITGGERTDDGQTVTVSLDFTNTADPNPVSPWDWLSLHVYQDGVELALQLAEQEEITMADPGETVTVAQSYTLRSSSPVLAELYGFRESTPCAALVIAVE